MSKPKKLKTWRIVGIVVTALVIIAGFAGSYALGVSRGADMDGEWTHPMSRFDEDGEEYSHGMMPMHGYSRGHGRSPIGGIFGFFLFILVIGAFLRLVFFPMRMARRAMMFKHGMGHQGCCHPGHHMHHGFHGYGHGDEECCGEKECECHEKDKESPSEE